MPSWSRAAISASKSAPEEVPRSAEGIVKACRQRRASPASWRRRCSTPWSACPDADTGRGIGRRHRDLRRRRRRDALGPNPPPGHFPLENRHDDGPHHLAAENDRGSTALISDSALSAGWEDTGCDRAGIGDPRRSAADRGGRHLHLVGLKPPACRPRKTAGSDLKHGCEQGHRTALNARSGVRTAAKAHNWRRWRKWA